jgi:hypothetical protein
MKSAKLICATICINYLVALPWMFLFFYLRDPTRARKLLQALEEFSLDRILATIGFAAGLIFCVLLRAEKLQKRGKDHRGF